MNFPSQSFAPFFDEIVKIRSPRPYGEVSASFKACVMPVSDAEPIMPELSTQSTRARFTVLLSASGCQAWLEAALGSRPQIGDRVELASGMKTVVRKVSPIVDAWYELECEQC
jgi:hypothetical protein